MRFSKRMLEWMMFVLVVLLQTFDPSLRVDEESFGDGLNLLIHNEQSGLEDRAWVI